MARTKQTARRQTPRAPEAGQAQKSPRKQQLGTEAEDSSDHVSSHLRKRTGKRKETMDDSYVSSEASGETPNKRPRKKSAPKPKQIVWDSARFIRPEQGNWVWVWTLQGSRFEGGDYFASCYSPGVVKSVKTSRTGLWAAEVAICNREEDTIYVPSNLVYTVTLTPPPSPSLLTPPLRTYHHPTAQPIRPTIRENPLDINVLRGHKDTCRV